MPIAIAADGGWARPTVGPGLEDFVAGDARAPAVVAAGGPGDAAPQTSTGNTARIALEAPVPFDPQPVPTPSPGRPIGLGREDLLKLLAAMTALLAAITGLVVKMVQQRGPAPAAT
jgi:hypothetical protein